jgi:protein TonB
MLKRSCTVSKYGRAGKPHSVTFTLLEDEDTLVWKGGGKSLRSSLGGKKDEQRRVSLRKVSHLLVGRDSAVFKRFQDDRSSSGRMSAGNWQDDVEEEDFEDLAPSSRHRSASAEKALPGQTHLSLSLQFPWAPGKERTTLDLSFDDELSFGLWVAALRVLIPLQALGPDLRRWEDKVPESSAATPPPAARSAAVGSASAEALRRNSIDAPSMPSTQGSLVRPTQAARDELSSMLDGIPPPQAAVCTAGSHTSPQAAQANPFGPVSGGASDPFSTEANPFDILGGPVSTSASGCCAAGESGRGGAMKAGMTMSSGVSSGVIDLSDPFQPSTLSSTPPQPPPTLAQPPPGAATPLFASRPDDSGLLRPPAAFTAKPASSSDPWAALTAAPPAACASMGGLGTMGSFGGVGVGSQPIGAPPPASAASAAPGALAQPHAARKLPASDFDIRQSATAARAPPRAAGAVAAGSVVDPFASLNAAVAQQWNVK